MAPTEHVPFGGDPIDGSESASSAAAIPSDYYDFATYVTKTRMLTFWHQLAEVLETEPHSVLEIGVGPQVVAGTLRELGVNLTTFDINPLLEPDLVGSVLELDDVVAENAFDTVLCARVLHHLPFTTLDRSLAQLARAARTRVVITLPIDEARLYFAVRRTAGQYKTASFTLPRQLKRLLLRVGKKGEERYRHLWKIDSHDETSATKVTTVIEQHFRIEKWYTVPEDQSHAVVVLGPK